MITGENKTILESAARSQAVSSRDAPDQQAEGLMGGEDNLESSDMNFECSAIIRNPNQNNKIIVNCDGLTDIEELDAKITEHIEKAADGQWMCDICKKIMRTRQHMKEHVVIHFDGLFFPCQHCSTVVKNRQSLRHHIRKKHEVSIKDRSRRT